MKHVRTCSKSGYSFMLALLFILVGMLMVTLFSFRSQAISSWVGSRKVAAVLQHKAEEGIEIALADLSVRLKNNNFKGGIETSASAVEVGLVPGTRETIVPRYYKKNARDKVDTKIYYFPRLSRYHSPTEVIQKGDEYLVIAEATHAPTGRSYSMEALISLVPETFASIAFGILNPKLLPGTTRFEFAPATYGGHVHFGDIPPSQLYFNVSEEENFNFLGIVTFQNAADAQTGVPYTKHPSAKLKFEKGYLDNQDELEDFFTEENLLGKAREMNTTRLEDAGLGLTEACLKFGYTSDAGKDIPKVEVWECNSDQVDPRQRYVGEISGGSPLAVYTGDRIVDCGSIICHAKGIVAGEQLIISDADFVIEGDIIEKGQNEESLDYFGVITAGDIIIPPMVPFDKGYAQLNRAPYSHPLNGITNFVAPEPDRDRGSASYFDPDGVQSSGTWKDLDGVTHVVGDINHPQVLDLEGAFLSMGVIKVEGIFHDNDDYASSAQVGMMLMDATGKKWNPLVYDDDQAYYYTNGQGSWQRKSEPAFCASPLAVGESCPLFSELPRPSAEAMHLFGSLFTEGYSFTQRSYGQTPRLGFKKNSYEFDKRFLKHPPLGFPSTGRLFVDVSWKKGFKGTSSLLKSYLEHH